MIVVNCVQMGPFATASLPSQVVPPFRPVGPGAKVLHESLLLRKGRKEKMGEKKMKKEREGKR